MHNEEHTIIVCFNLKFKIGSKCGCLKLSFNDRHNENLVRMVMYFGLEHDCEFSRVFINY